MAPSMGDPSSPARPSPPGKEFLRPVYKPHSVQRTTPPVQSSLWAARHRAARCGLPGAGLYHKRERHVWRRAVSHRPRTISPLLGLAPGGGYLAARITAGAGGLLHHLFTIATPTLHPPPKSFGFWGRAGEGAVCFCGPYPAGSRLSAASPPRVLSDAVLYGVRTFLDPVSTGPRLPDQPEERLSYTSAGHASTF